MDLTTSDCQLYPYKARGMKIFVLGFRTLYDTAKGPDSEFNEGPRGLFALRLNSIQNA